MEPFDIFKKLVTGAKFDKHRFYEDAARFQLVKPNSPSQTLLGADPLLASKKSKRKKVVEHSENAEHENKRVKFMKNDDDDEVKLFSNDATPLASEESRTLPKNKVKTAQQLADLKQEHINHVRKKNRIYVHGTDIPPLVENFESLVTDYHLHPRIVKNVVECGYESPTPIQMQALPIMLSQREILASAPTGSGKTAAFIIPVLHTLKKPRKLGFRAVIVTPTRELARQTYLECRRLAEGVGLRIHIIDKVQKTIKKFSATLAKKFDILITTPNRLVYLINHEPPLIDLSSVQWLVVDESDKLFEDGQQGFRDQLAIIYKACSSPNIKHAMFSATFSFEVEEWCKLNLDNVVQVSIGIRNTAADLVEQTLTFVGNEHGKLVAFRDLVKKGLKPPVLVFVQTKDRAKELFGELIYDGINVDVIHADRTQLQRDNVVKSFRSGKIWVLICTELMGRGIDFKGVNLVVNYDFPPTIISYIHRIGRTGRAGRSGKAVTFFTEDDVVNLRSIAQVMKDSGCEVPQYMLELKKPKKKDKQKLAQSALKRPSISTVPLYDIEKEKKKKKAIEKSKKKMASASNANGKN